jgi:hypothetical protein
MMNQPDRYTKVILTVIAILLAGILFKDQIPALLSPTKAHALSRLEGVVDENGNQMMLTDVYIRNTDAKPVPVKVIGKVILEWNKPMPVYLVDTSK